MISASSDHRYTEVSPDLGLIGRISQAAAASDIRTVVITPIRYSPLRDATHAERVTERSRTFSWADPAELAAASREATGLAFVKSMARGELPPPPIASLLGMEIVDVAPSRVVFALEPAEWMFNPIGSVHGGVAATLLDSAMGCAIQTALPVGAGYTTADVQVRYLRAMTAETGRVLATGTVIQAGRRQATAEGRMEVQATGKLIATGTTGCLVL